VVPPPVRQPATDRTQGGQQSLALTAHPTSPQPPMQAAAERKKAAKQQGVAAAVAGGGGEAYGAGGAVYACLVCWCCHVCGRVPTRKQLGHGTLQPSAPIHPCVNAGAACRRGCSPSTEHWPPANPMPHLPHADVDMDASGPPPQEQPQEGVSGVGDVEMGTSGQQQQPQQQSSHKTKVEAKKALKVKMDTLKKNRWVRGEAGGWVEARQVGIPGGAGAWSTQRLHMFVRGFREAHPFRLNPCPVFFWSAGPR